MVNKNKLNFSFQPLNREQAMAILNWRYPVPYNCYNFDPVNTLEDLQYLLDERNAFFAISNLQGELEGFCSFSSDGRVPGGRYDNEALDMGMGIRPDLIGRGRGRLYALAVAKYAIERYQTQQLRVTIAKFNQRAQRVWKRLGFKQVEQFIKIGSEAEFVVMTRKSASAWLYLKEQTSVYKYRDGFNL